MGPLGPPPQFQSLPAADVGAGGSDPVADSGGKGSGTVAIWCPCRGTGSPSQPEVSQDPSLQDSTDRQGARPSRAGLPSRQQLPFSVIGSLNGVHMFGRNLDVGLASARTEDSVVVWKTFHDSITLIVLSSEEGASALSLERLLELVFGAMVLLIGLEELTDIRNVERLKKELRACHGLIDSLLCESERVGDLTQCVDCIVSPDGPLLQEALSGFAESVGAAFACLVAGGRVAAGTPGWWRLAAPESILLPWLLGTLPPHSARDYPVYLPHGSPTVPHRLLTLMLLPGLELGLLCGPGPALAQFTPQLLDRWWQPLLEPLRACLLLLPRGLPPSLTLAPAILGLLFVHLEQRRCLFTVQPGGPAGEGPAPSQRRKLLRWWFSFVTAEHFAAEPSDGCPGDGGGVEGWGRKRGPLWKASSFPLLLPRSPVRGRLGPHTGPGPAAGLLRGQPRRPQALRAEGRPAPPPAAAGRLGPHPRTPGPGRPHPPGPHAPPLTPGALPGHTWDFDPSHLLNKDISPPHPGRPCSLLGPAILPLPGDGGRGARHQLRLLHVFSIYWLTGIHRGGGGKGPAGPDRPLPPTVPLGA
uniref:Fuzzy planar cell polarity protein n=1 Tax=Ornithorhynchus anatinus TaxID=9258 RepID=A0A6I8PEB9_ORNAN